MIQSYRSEDAYKSIEFEHKEILLVLLFVSFFLRNEVIKHLRFLSEQKAQNFHSLCYQFQRASEWTTWMWMPTIGWCKPAFKYKFQLKQTNEWNRKRKTVIKTKVKSTISDNSQLSSQSLNLSHSFSKHFQLI